MIQTLRFHTTDFDGIKLRAGYTTASYSPSEFEVTLETLTIGEVDIFSIVKTEVILAIESEIATREATR